MYSSSRRGSPSPVRDFSFSTLLAFNPAVEVHEGASARLNASYINPNATYNGAEAITVYVNEARNENG